MIEPQYGSPAQITESSAREVRARALLRLLDEWLTDTSGYDERVWPEVKEGIDRNRLSARSRLGEDA